MQEECWLVIPPTGWGGVSPWAHRKRGLVSIQASVEQLTCKGQATLQLHTCDMFTVSGGDLGSVNSAFKCICNSVCVYVYDKMVLVHGRPIPQGHVSADFHVLNSQFIYIYIVPKYITIVVLFDFHFTIPFVPLICHCCLSLL